MAALAAQAAHARDTSQPIILTPALSPPPGSSRPVDHTFPSLAFEKTCFYAYAGNSTHPNLFSHALVDILQKKVGVPLWIRIGGTSADQDHYNATQEVAVVRPDPPHPSGGLWGYSIGKSYFDSLMNFNTSQFIWMLPMAHSESGHVSRDALEQAQMAIFRMRGRLEMIELGNEPNLYHAQGMRGPEYDVAKYVNEALQHTDDVERGFLPKGTVKYQALAYDSGCNHDVWNTQKAFAAGINRNGTIHSVSMHYYQSIAAEGVTLRRTLMNHTATASKLSRFIPELRFLHAQNPNISFVLGEVGSVIAPELKWDIQATFGNALWTVDAMLYSMSINVTRMHMQSGTGFGYALWNSTQARPTCYSMAMVADFVGHNMNATLRIKELETKSETMVAYAAYEGRHLKRMALLNMNMWNATQGPARERPVQDFKFRIPKGVKRVQLKRLMADGATESGGVSWGGVRWIKDSCGVKEEKVDGGLHEWMLNGTDTTLAVGVRDSEAAMVEFFR